MKLLSKRLVEKKEFMYESDSELSKHHTEMLSNGWIASHYLTLYEDEVRYIWIYEKEMELYHL